MLVYLATFFFFFLMWDYSSLLCTFICPPVSLPKLHIHEFVVWAFFMLPLGAFILCFGIYTICSGPFTPSILLLIARQPAHQFGCLIYVHHPFLFHLVIKMFLCSHNPRLWIGESLAWWMTLLIAFLFQMTFHNPIFVHVTNFFLIILSTQEFPPTGPHFQTESYSKMHGTHL